MGVHERDFQAQIVKQLKSELPGCIVLKNDANYRQGIPDLLILYKSRWAALECKKSQTASKRPNQDYYVAQMNDMSYAAFIYPENKEEVFHELHKALGA